MATLREFNPEPAPAHAQAEPPPVDLEEFRVAAAPDERYQVWIDQRLCTGDGLCVQEASNVFEFDIDGLAYVKDDAGELLTDAGARADVPADTFDEVVLSARKCPGLCIHVVRTSDGVEVEGPDAQ